MPTDKTISERLKLGQASYKSGNLVEASHHLKSASKSCACQTGKPNLECTCVNFSDACKNRTLDSALRTSCKCPRRANKRCKDESHITALGSLVMVAIKAKDHKLAQIYAQNLIYLAPRDPRGYLRLGQVLRLMEKHHTALSVYQQGIGLVARANPDHSGLKTLKEQESILRKLTSQVDPLEALPAELLVLVLGQLNTRHHCRCLRLSKSWKAFMESQAARPTWTCQHFDSKISKAPPRTIKPYMAQRYLVKYPGGQLRSLRLDDCRSIPLVRDKLTAVLRACPQLQHLALDGEVMLETGELPPLEKMPKLISLKLAREVTIRMQLLQHLIEASRETLEELDLYKLPFQDQGNLMLPTPTRWPVLPRLSALRLRGWNKRHRVDMDYIVYNTPNLQTVWIDFMSYTTNPTIAAAARSGRPCWPKLKRAYVGEDVVFGPVGAARFPPLPECLEELVVNHQALLSDSVFHPPYVTEAAVAGTEDWGAGRREEIQVYDAPHNVALGALMMPAWHLPCLKTIVLKGSAPLTHMALRCLIGPAISSDRLRYLEIHPFPWGQFGPRGQAREWAGPSDGATGVTTLGVNMLNGELGRNVSNVDDALLQLVGLFPNLVNLDIGSETVASPTLGRILGSNGVQTIYHSQGASMFEVKDWAESRGKNVVQGRYYDYYAHNQMVESTGGVVNGLTK
ncbi:hypothetical protein BKA67DRAFT_536536 [Truncatella angustata]|uniref:F-box domain-containing protein n=1 Tax=Truncatella angustata TaxID=152316 RepID=A0A9P8ZXB0_9PEZI|nr:uncharacterized protein BKA67DRAFT_536536 [Truncatella angustata]KAH6652819.1 hypothetical protein BKA67DRAFT_536536 [Truncatella angustata]